MDKKSQTKTNNWTKKDLAASISRASGLSKEVSSKALDATIESLKSALKEKKKVTIKHFGTFKVWARPAMEGRNPKTGESIQIRARNVPKLIFSKSTKDGIA